LAKLDFFVFESLFNESVLVAEPDIFIYWPMLIWKNSGLSGVCLPKARISPAVNDGNNDDSISVRSVKKQYR
jgi:hypothetical protein